MATYIDSLESEIERVARERLGAAVVLVFNYEARARTSGKDPGAREFQGTWHGVSVRLPGDTESTILGRRRTREELLELVQRIHPAHVGGVRFGTCQRTARPVGAR